MESKNVNAEKKSRKREAEEPSIVIVPEKKRKKKKEDEETTTESEVEKRKNKKKKSRKMGKTEDEAEAETESGSLLRKCSSSERKKGATEPETEKPIIVPEKKEEEETTNESKKAQKKKSSRYGSLKPLITTVTTTTTTTTRITIITPPEDPKYHIHLYFCVWDTDGFSWFEIDPSNTTVEPPKDHLILSSNSNNIHYYSATLLTVPISQMPPMPSGFHVIPHSSPTKQKKLVYAVGGRRSSKALVCDFASSSPTWEELPPMPSELRICIGLVNPLDGNVYAFGYTCPKVPSHPLIKMGLVFDPSSNSWNQCPHPFGRYGYPHAVNDYALIDTEDRTELNVFSVCNECHLFNLTTARWDSPLCAPVPNDSFGVTSSSVGVGHIIFKFHNFKLYALDSSSSSHEPSFEPVLGLEKEFATVSQACTTVSIAYLGKGKLCIVWDTKPNHPPENATERPLYIHCLKFWVGVCNQTNRLRAVIDRCERFSTHAGILYSVVAL